MTFVFVLLYILQYRAGTTVPGGAVLKTPIELRVFEMEINWSQSPATNHQNMCANTGASTYLYDTASTSAHAVLALALGWESRPCPTSFSAHIPHPPCNAPHTAGDASLFLLAFAPLLLLARLALCLSLHGCCILVRMLLLPLCIKQLNRL